MEDDFKKKEEERGGGRCVLSGAGEKGQEGSNDVDGINGNLTHQPAALC